MQPLQNASPIRIRYGNESSYQFGDLYLTAASATTTTVVVLHGGFWRPHRGLEMTSSIARDLASRGWNVWNLEYRRTGHGGWRRTLDDCDSGTSYLHSISSKYPIDPARLIMLGHSAGGQLAVRTAAAGTAQVMATVSLAGVLDLQAAARAGIGESAVHEFLGYAPEGYRMADPVAHLPIGIPVRCLHGREDERVPFELSARYVEAALNNADDAVLVEVPGQHTDVINIHHEAWRTSVDVLAQLIG